MKLDFKTLLIAVLIALLLFRVGFDVIGKGFFAEEVVSIKTKTETKTEYITKIERITDTVFLKPKPVSFKTHDPVTNQEVLVKANEYFKEYTLPNADVKATIITTGELLSFDFDIKTKDKIITKETFIEKKVVQSGLFGVGGATVSLDGRIADLHTGVAYVHKNSWLIEAGLQYNTDNTIAIPLQDRAGISVRVGFKF